VAQDQKMSTMTTKFFPYWIDYKYWREQLRMTHYLLLLLLLLAITNYFKYY